MTTNNDITNDRITNALKGDKEKYRTGWEAIFGKSKEEMKEHVKPITNDTPHDVVEVEDLGEASEEELKEGAKRSTQRVKKRADEILDEITRLDQEMGLYDEHKQ